LEGEIPNTEAQMPSLEYFLVDVNNFLGAFPSPHARHGFFMNKLTILVTMVVVVVSC